MVKAIVGANWGDEGKGKITDMLAQDSDIIIRFQGGANAGHELIPPSFKNLVFYGHGLTQCPNTFHYNLLSFISKE